MQPLADTGEPELRDYVRVLRRRKWVVALTTVAVVAIAIGLSVIQASVYKASSEVLLQPRISEQIFNPDPNQQTSSNQQTVVQTEIEVMKSRSVKDAVTTALGHVPHVGIAARGQTNVVTITADSTDPKGAADEANTYADTYVTVRRQAQIDDLLAAAAEVQAQIQKIDDQIVALQAPIDALEQQIAATDNKDERANLQAQHDQLVSDSQTQLTSLQNRRAAYADQLDQLTVAGNLTKTGGAQIVSKAEIPTSPFKPTPRRDGIVALFLGMLLGVGLAFLREYLDDTIKSKDDLDAATPGLVALTLVPAVSTWKDRDEPVIVSVSAPHSPAAEAYRTLRTSIQFIGLEQTVGVTQLTSPSAAEGKTTTLANLGVSLARAGARVVLVDCDLRRPRLHRFFGLSNEIGFTSVLLRDASLANAMQPVPSERFLALLPSGPVPPNPSELLSSPRMADLLAALRGECDYVLVDTPPVLPVTDALVVAGVVDATILVVTANSTTKRDTHRAMELLAQVGAPLVGTVLNGIDHDAGYGYQYGYRYAYGRDGRGADPRRGGRGERAKVTEPDWPPGRS